MRHFANKKKIFIIATIILVVISILLLPNYLIKLNNILIRNNTKKIVIDLNVYNRCGGHGFGNQLFMFSFAYSVAKKYGITNLAINNHPPLQQDDQENFSDASNRNYALNKFGINYPVMYGFNGLTEKEKAGSVQIKKFRQLETITSLKDLIFKLRPHTMIIRAIFPKTIGKDCMYYSYFKEEEQELKNIFKYNQKLSVEAEDLLDKIHNANSVGMHVRRGDYVGLKWNITLDYYVKALNLIINNVENPKLFIFTDDVDYVKHYFTDPENLNKVKLTNDTNIAKIYKLLNNATYVSEKLNHSLEEFHLMSNCKHNIIPNSTFSWWAAFLNNNPNKIVIIPKLYAQNIFTKFFPEKNWVSLEY